MNIYKKKFDKTIYKNKIGNLLVKGNDLVIAPSQVDYRKTSFNSANSNFLRKLEFALIKYKKITLSFKYTKNLKATALLVIYSIIDTKGKGKEIKIILSEVSDIVNAIIINTGNFQPPEKRLEILEKKISLPIIQGNNKDVIKLQKKIITAVVELYLDKNDINFEDRKFDIGIAIQETLDNVGRHAYPDTDHIDRRWWFCCDMIDETLFIAIYDAGVGIPMTILNSNIDYMKLIELNYENHQSLQDKFKNSPKPTVTAHLKETLSHQSLIKAAMSNDLSTTTKDKHGKGSSRIKALIKNEKESFLLIFSCKGMYQYSLYNKDGNDKGKEIESPLDNHLKGTLIQWSL